MEAFNFISSCLSVNRQLGNAQSVSPEPDAEDFWESVVGTANNHLLTPALWISLQRRAMTDCIPDDLRSYFEGLYQLSVERNIGLRQQAKEAILALNAAGIEPVLLKGIVHLFTNTYGYLGLRIMTDIDILVEADEYDACLAILRGLGYESDPASEDKYLIHHHCAPLFRPGDYGAIEVHRQAVSGLCERILSSDTVWSNLEYVAIDGATAKVMKPSYRVLHTILHSELNDRNHARGVMALRYLHEVATMGTVYGEIIDWRLLATLMRHNGQAHVLRHFLYICHRLFGLEVPNQFRIGPGCIVHFIQCQAQLRYAWLDRFVRRLDRWLSRQSIIRRYGYRESPVWIAIGRVRVVAYHIRCFCSRLFSRPTGDA